MKNSEQNTVYKQINRYHSPNSRFYLWCNLIGELSASFLSQPINNQASSDSQEKTKIKISIVFSFTWASELLLCLFRSVTKISKLIAISWYKSPSIFFFSYMVNYNRSIGSNVRIGGQIMLKNKCDVTVFISWGVWSETRIAAKQTIWVAPWALGGTTANWSTTWWAATTSAAAMWSACSARWTVRTTWRERRETRLTRTWPGATGRYTCRRPVFTGNHWLVRSHASELAQSPRKWM